MMVQIIAEITWRCPARCPFCPVPKSNKVMRLEDYAVALQLFKDYFRTDMAVVLSGGEPSTVENLKQYVNLARRLGYTVTIATNAWNPERIIEARPDVIEVSIDYYGAKHDATRGLPGIFSNAVRLLEEATANKILAIVRSTVTNDNVEDLVYLRHYLNMKGLHQIPIIAMPVRGAPHLSPTKGQLELLESQGFIIADSCPAGISSFVITPNMEILACIFYRKQLGKLRRFILDEIEAAVTKGRRLPRYPCKQLGA